MNTAASRNANTAASSDRGQGYTDHLERSQRVWDRWSDWYGLSEKDFEPIRERAIDRLDLQDGDHVLDVGCGPGVNFAYSRSQIGSEGQLVAVDYSPAMVENATDRVDQYGWENVEVRQADATTVDFDEQFDAVIATLSLGVMPDAHSTIENIYRLLAPGGRLAVVDVRPAPSGPLRLLNPIIWRVFRWYANWNPENDVTESLHHVFDECELAETVFGTTAYAMDCRKSNGSDRFGGCCSQSDIDR
ncbi:putative S-adenosylmethionine-dependent methyltransferase (plasmid) [Natrialba magadii ATCC 43099]|uniref:S-adenosylmethionine-dependent methyltransferase n=1 Tax=Natrialba magadii (strain ATCC 43099 / DSM 3394 / CCM 3739 / CIP 104546 / IAM 13178 / JCM 8861 / NBRC 102185 / NCIMB 2190 / MS3) TaxID=547559 RepID=D3T118_NATMM|nr:methyltransferase domain-containing protein [Natrialba magadii]ADD07277.1 putative S-adenosylmethionine-dependent methyltransferase [Natrialba magadii ATCC 43099]ELY34386.1 type 11 methyltransferase [Natrialba magadii ATCC 43099]